MSQLHCLCSYTYGVVRQPCAWYWLSRHAMDGVRGDKGKLTGPEVRLAGEKSAWRLQTGSRVMCATTDPAWHTACT